MSRETMGIRNPQSARLRSGQLRRGRPIRNGAAALLLLLSLPAAAAPQTGAFSDEAVARAIERGVAFLWANQQADGSWKTVDTNKNEWYTVGPTALCAYALLESGVPPADPRMAKALTYLERTPSEMTYCLAFRSLAFAAAYARDPKYRDLMRRDVRALMMSIDREGGYTYFSHGKPPARGEYSQFAGGAADNSNSQYGLLGVWAGRLQGEEIPRQYWELSLNFWLKRQREDGGWGYSPKGRPESCLSMTLAGLASLYVCLDDIHDAKQLACGANPELLAVRKALTYLDQSFDSLYRMGNWFYYTLYGMERVALATGYKYFGQRDWYRLGAAELIARQNETGSWTAGAGQLDGGPCCSTAYALVFLLRGRRPVVFNRLEYDGDWNNRPRALANLMHWFSRQFERELHWQIVGLRGRPEDWHDAPLLVLTGSKAPTFTDEHVEKLRTFVRQGGTLFSIAECGGAGFQKGIRELYGRLFPGRELTPLPTDHTIYKIQFRLGGKPALHEVSNGARPLAIHTDEDLPRAWQAGLNRTVPLHFDVTANVVAYTNDRAALTGELRARGTSLWPEPYTAPPRLTARVARLRHAGNWDVEPLAWERLARLLGASERIRLEVLGPMEISELAGSPAKLAAMTGTGPLELTDAQKKQLKAWLEGGGTLLLDAAGGNEAFATSAEGVLIELFGRPAVRTLATTAELYNVKGFEIKLAGYRRATPGPPRLRGVMVHDRPAVYLSRDDLTCALLGSPASTISGYTPKTAYAIARNLVILTCGQEVAPASPDAILADASVNAEAARNAVDGDPATRWDTGRPMKEGDCLTIDLGRERAVQTITLSTRGSPENFPRAYRVFISRDGKDWFKGLEADHGAALMTITFPPSARVRFVKFELAKGDEKLSWSVHEVEVKAE